MMIKLITLLLLGILPVITNADCTKSAKVAEKLMTDYYVYLKQLEITKKVPENSFELWLEKSNLVTNNFKTAYKKLVVQARKEDQELGLDLDPMFNAQDYPDQGFKILECDKLTGAVTLVPKTKDWENFKVFAKVIATKTKKSLQVDGMGAINMPEPPDKTKIQ